MPNNYSFLSQLLHRLALGNKFIAEASFEIEQSMGRFDPSGVIYKRHIFVSGLARAGTTILMRRFYATGLFRSLTYRDMPFVLMPTIWNKLSGYSRSEMDKVERAHGDGIMVDFDSPEALEEVFWRVFAGYDYITPKFLIPMEADREMIQKFRQYVSSILNAPEKEEVRYLSKNNNNILRLPSVKRAFPNAIIIIPFREPMQQAMSLLKLHVHFTKEHSKNPFSRSYMTWLGHHEFGSDHRRFRFGGEDNPHPQDCLDYWLTIWLDTYRWLRANAPSDVVFLSYEALCDNTDVVWGKMKDLFDIHEGNSENLVEIKRSGKDTFGSVSAKNIDSCMHLYKDLSDRMNEMIYQ